MFKRRPQPEHPYSMYEALQQEQKTSRNKQLVQVLSTAIVTVVLIVAGIWIWRVSSQESGPGSSQITPAHTQPPQNNTATPSLPPATQENSRNQTNQGNISTPAY